MDDDGFPASDALQRLRESTSPGVACASSIVVQEDSPDEFVFPFLCLTVLDCLWSSLGSASCPLFILKPYSREGCYPFAHLFNGVMSSVAISEIGNVNPDFFIFGDEVDIFFDYAVREMLFLFLLPAKCILTLALGPIHQ